MKKNLILLSVALFMLPTQSLYANWFGGPHIEQGMAGYCVHRPTFGGIIGLSGGFQAVVTGPRKYGFSVKNIQCNFVDLRNQRLSEDFKILSSDELKMKMNVYIVLRIKKSAEAIRTLIEDYGFDQESGNSDVDQKHGDPLWYTRNVEEPFRTIVRNIAQKYSSSDMIAKREEIASKIITAINNGNLFDEKPYELVRVDVGDIQYPDKIVNAIEDKMVEDQNLVKAEKQQSVVIVQAKTSEERAEGEKLAAIKKAEGQAKAMELVREQLTDEYIRYIEAQAQLEGAKNANKTVFFFNGSSNPSTVYDISEEAMLSEQQ